MKKFNIRIKNEPGSAPIPRVITDWELELDEMQVIGGPGFEESVKYFVSGSGKSVPLESVPEHIRKRVEDLRNSQES